MKLIIRAVIATAAILMIPVVGMQVSGEWNWSGSDFALMGAILFVVALAFQWVTRKGPSLAYRAGGALAVLGSFFMVWVNLAVGIIGDDNPANLLYFIVILVGVIGAAVSTLEPRGMMRTTAAMAAATVLVPVTALLFWQADVAPGMAQVFVLSIAMALPFAGAAILFKRASVA